MTDHDEVTTPEAAAIEGIIRRAQDKEEAKVETPEGAVLRLMDEAIAAEAEYDSLYAFAWDNFRRAETAERNVERLREENRSLVQTIRRVLRAEPVDEQVRSELVGMTGNRDRLLDDKARLLKVLEGWLQLHSFPHMPEDVFEMADQTHAAIAKAKGVTER